MKIKKFKDVAIGALREIKDYQSGKKKIIKTNRPYLDDHFPVVNGSVITISAPSGVGKTFELLRILRNVMDVSVNPDAMNYVCLNVSLEMKIFNIVLRALNSKLNKKKIDIVLKDFSEDEKLLVREYQEYISDDRQYITQEPITAEEFRKGCKEFLDEHKDKESVFIGFDHLALIKRGSGSKNDSIEGVMEVINDLKMEYHNAVFILVSQTNSDIEKRADEKSRRSQPIKSDLYYSGFTFQVSDYVVVMVNAYNLGLKSYSKVDMERYPNLEKYFVEIDEKKGKASLETYGVIYYHLLKVREAENGMYLDIYAEDMKIDGVEEKRAKRRDELSDELLSMPSFEDAPF